MKTAAKMAITIQPKGNWKPHDINEAGINSLTNVSELVIKQHLSITEALTGWEKCNRYNLWNAKTGEILFFAREEKIHCCTRNMCGSEREFTMPFVDSTGNEVFRLEKPRALVSLCCNVCTSFCLSCCTCCGMDTNLTNLTVKINETPEFFAIQKEMTSTLCCTKPFYKIRDLKEDKVVYTVSHDSCVTSAVCCGDVVYHVEDNERKLVGNLTKYWGGGKSCWTECTSASTFVLKFPENATNRQKVALIAMQLLLDFAYYQVNGED